MANLSNINNKFLVTTGGNVGIGTTAPEGKLDVTGNIWLNSDNANAAYYLKINRAQSQDGGILLYGNKVLDWQLVNLANRDLNWYSYTAASSVMRLTGAGNLGIGTTNPLDLLHLKSATTDARLLIDGHTGFDAELKFAENGTVKYTIGYDAAGDNFVIGTTNVDTQQRLVVDSSGNVGIGAASPDFALDIEASGSGVQLQIGRTSSNVGSTWMGSDSNGFHLGVGAYGSGNSVSDPNGFTVNTSGKLGIGTASPDKRLTVGGVNATEGINLKTKSGSNVWTIWSVEQYFSQEGYMRLFYDNVSKIQFRADGDSFFNGGNVGIGTTNPAYKLVVYETGTATSNIAIDARATGAGTNNYAVWAQGSGASSTNFAFYGAAGKNAFLGNTGIGTDNPGATLDVDDDNTGKLRLLRNGSVRAEFSNNANEGELSLYRSNNSKYVYLSSYYNCYIDPQQTSAVVGIGGAGVGIASSGQGGNTTLDVQGPLRNKRVMRGWYHCGPITSTDAYRHIKTNLWMGGSPSGNTEYIMGGFEAKGYAYFGSYPGFGHGTCMFHNWSGSFASLQVANYGTAGFMQSPYVSTDGYCVIVLRHNTYMQPAIDFSQYYTPYPWRIAYVTAETTSPNTTGVY